MMNTMEVATLRDIREIIDERNYHMDSIKLIVCSPNYLEVAVDIEFFTCGFCMSERFRLTDSLPKDRVDELLNYVNDVMNNIEEIKDFLYEVA